MCSIVLTLTATPLTTPFTEPHVASLHLHFTSPSQSVLESRGTFDVTVYDPADVFGEGGALAESGGELRTPHFFFAQVSACSHHTVAHVYRRSRTVSNGRWPLRNQSNIGGSSVAHVQRFGWPS
jgi:hypothetical protein